MASNLPTTTVIHCFQCQRDITTLNLVARTRHVEQCLGLAPLVTTVNPSLEGESPTSDFKPTGCARGLTRSTTLPSAWTDCNGQTSLRSVQTPLTQTSPHPETTPREGTQGVSHRSDSDGGNGLPGPETSVRPRKATARGSSSRLTKEDRNCPDFQLALALSASLIKPQVSDVISTTGASHQGSRTRKRRSKKGSSDKANDNPSKVQATLTTDINLPNRPTPKHKHGLAASGSTPPSTSVWPVSAAKQLGAQNMWVILRQGNDSPSDELPSSSPCPTRQTTQSLNAAESSHLSPRPTSTEIPTLELPPSSIPSLVPTLVSGVSASAQDLWTIGSLSPTSLSSEDAYRLYQCPFLQSRPIC
ncbi:hypothetical protein IWQ62_004508 [Dispira parvispora]|uniref:Uncharacterized protein n=1 Tax=Dispira parvispora TaxID=1520584 RepID=A0A9W8E1W9_9FUNG|nr:hypothetical protein IWQ62_004508 [Dispira parvispora]